MNAYSVPGTGNKTAESEPQNPLTREFTEKEWEALRELRVCYFCYRHTPALTQGLDKGKTSVYL